MVKRQSALDRLVVPSAYVLPPTKVVLRRPAIDELLRTPGALVPVEVLRPEDLVHLSFLFLNLTVVKGDGGVPTLVRRKANEPAFLLVDCKAQHATEAAMFEVAANYPIPHRDPPDDDPDEGATQSVPDPPPAPPVFSSLAGSSRLVLKVTDQRIPYTTEGLLAAMSRLDLSVAPQAVPPATVWRFVFADLWKSDAIDVKTVLRAANGPMRGRGGKVEVGDGATRVSGELIAAGRLRAAAAAVEYRFGTAAAADALQAVTLGSRLGIVDKIDLGQILRAVKPPLPAPPDRTHTALELPWRLIVSPNNRAAFAHSPTAVQFQQRYEVWHTRLGVRAVDKTGKPVLDAAGNPTVDEKRADLRTIRALWARDFDVLGPDGFGFASPPASENFPNADGHEDKPPNPPVRMALNSRDRMMLVHETSNFHLIRQREDWTPPAVPANRLMLTALGGWLDSRVVIDELPDGGLTIQEWKHRAAMGRDHEVKVVYAGFLLPFGHRASLVKVTERKIKEGARGKAAYLFQRMFLIVREPEKRFRNITQHLPAPDGRRLDLVMPLGTVHILTRVTPPLDEPKNLLGAGYFFQPSVAGATFEFKVLAVDLEGNVVEFAAPMVFMERDHNDTAAHVQAAVDTYNTSTKIDREFDLRGQRMAFAESQAADDTALATASLTFEVATAGFLQSRPQDDPRFEPVLEEASAVVPAMSALAGAAAPTTLAYPAQYAANGFAGNAAQVFLKALDTPAFGFAGQGDRSGGLVTPSLKVKGLSRLTGPIGGDLDKAIEDPGNFSVGGFFDGISAKLFGLIPLKELFGALGFTPDRVPKFVTQTLDIASTLKQNLERIRNEAQAQAAQLGAAASTLRGHVDALLADLAALVANPTTPPDLAADLNAIAADLDPFIAAVEGAPALPETAKQQLVGIVNRVKDQLSDAAAVAAAVQALIAFANGFKLPDVITARLDWSTDLDPWPAAGNDAIFSPIGGQGRITLAVEVQAPTKAGKEPSALVSCSISPFDLRLIGPATFIVLHFETMEFLLATGKKPDVNVKFRDPDGIEFAGPLEFVNTLKDIIPFDGFSDPPYLDVTAQGVKAGFDLSIPDLAVGVFALSNIALGANLRVPFIDESIEASFNFCTRENPFRLQVSLFAGGGFFGITITPKRVRVLEASFEFGAAISINFGVASGGVSVMAGVYFRLETDASGERAQLTGYFRLRGEVDVLGLISASIELYLELTYETSTGKAVGRATLTIEVEVLFLSFSVSISCEKKFAGSNGDPTFEDVMGLPPGAPPGAVRPWDAYCHAFADD